MTVVDIIPFYPLNAFSPLLMKTFLQNHSTSNVKCASRFVLTSENGLKTEYTLHASELIQHRIFFLAILQSVTTFIK